MTEAGVPDNVNVAAPAGPTVKLALAAEAASAIPDVRVAVNVIDSAFVYCTDDNVTLLVPFAIVPAFPVSAPTPTPTT